MVVDGQFKARAVRELAHVLAVEFLPGRLVGQVGLFPISFAAGEFFVADEHIGRAGVEVDPHAVPGFEKREAPSDSGFGRRIEDGRAGRRAALTPVANAGQFGNAGLHEPVRREHVDDFGRAGIAHRPAIAHEQHGIFVNGQRGVIDAVVIILRAIKDHGRALPGVFIAFALEVSFAKVVADDRGFEQARVKEVAAEHDKARVFFQGLVVRLDDALVFNGNAFEVFAHGFARDAHAVWVEFVCLDEFGHDRGHAACSVKRLAQVGARGLAVDEQRDVVAMGLPVFCRKRVPDVPRNRGDVNRGIGRSPKGRVDHNGVLKGVGRQNFGRGEVFFDHVHDAEARAIRHLLAGAIGRGNGRTARQG